MALVPVAAITAVDKIMSGGAHRPWFILIPRIANTVVLGAITFGLFVLMITSSPVLGVPWVNEALGYFMTYCVLTGLDFGGIWVYGPGQTLPALIINSQEILISIITASCIGVFQGFNAKPFWDSVTGDSSGIVAEVYHDGYVYMWFYQVASYIIFFHALLVLLLITIDTVVIIRSSFSLPDRVVGMMRGARNAMKTALAGGPAGIVSSILPFANGNPMAVPDIDAQYAAAAAMRRPVSRTVRFSDEKAM